MPPQDITTILIELGRDEKAVDRFLPLVYDELQVLARQHRFRWDDTRAPGTSSLVHEAYLRLVDQTRVDWRNRAQFFYLASRAMRSVLIDNARWHYRQKRGGGVRPLPIEDLQLVSEQRSDELLALDEALDGLKDEDGRLAKIVECRVFGGLTIEETAEALEVSTATVKRGWRLARAWLYQSLGENGALGQPA